MPELRALLWIDFESTGVLTDPDVPTLLEAAWTITDPDGVQLVPLRHRFMCLPAAQDQDREDRWIACAPAPGGGEDFDGPPGWYSENSGWSETTGYPSDTVRRMHWGNGLVAEYADYLRTARDPAREQPITEWADLDDRLHADLLSVGALHWEPGQVALAGAGVSHYENLFLRHCAPETMGMRAMHYSAGVDVSTVLRSLSVRYSSARAGGDALPDLGKADRLLRHAAQHAHGSWLPDGVSRIELASGAGQWSTRDRDAAGWMDAAADSHRAAPGIVRALLAYRMLPYAVDVLSVGYGDALDERRAARGSGDG